jgi:hypothetical protein
MFEATTRCQAGIVESSTLAEWTARMGGGLLLAMSFSVSAAPVPVPEILHYKFDEAGTTVTNHASAPPAGTETGTIMGTLVQGGSFSAIAGELTGTGQVSTVDYVNTNWQTSLPGSWTVSFFTSAVPASSTLWYIFGDVNAGGFRCFTNGVAGPNNWMLRGTGITDVYVNGAAVTAPHMTTYVYDQAANTIYGYLDGVLVTTVPQAGAPVISGIGPFKVGGYATNAGLNGNMADYRLYSHALTDAEVANLYLYITTQTPLTTDTSHVDTTCNGGTDGTATAIPTGGTPPFTYSWSPSGGTGVTETGLAAGTYTVTVTDDFGDTAQADATVAEPTAVVFSTTSLPDATQFTPYSTSIAASGGTGTITYAQTAGTLPAGVTLATDGTLAGTPTEGGSFTFTVTATDGNSCGAPMDFTLFVDDTIFENGFDGP